MCGIIAPGRPRVMHRSHKVKSSMLSNGPSSKLLRVRSRELTMPWMPLS
jgi:hypothetical protein